MKDQDLTLTIASRIKAAREERQISQQKLADMSGLHRTYISMVERSEKNITVVGLNKIAEALNIKIIDLIK